MKTKYILGLVLYFVLVSIYATGGPVSADVTIKGRVEFYDRLSGQTKPAKNVAVKVRGNWWFTGDPETQTDDNGYYTAKQRDPITGTFDIHINVFAQTQDKIGIYEWMLAWNTYNVDSPTVTGIQGGQTCTVNLVIGGPRSNVTNIYCRNVEENANAFLIHQEILEHYKKLERMGFPANLFQNTDVIAPAMGQTSYYNYISDFINLTETSLLGKEGWNWGTSEWTNLSNNDSHYIPYKYILDMARHESSHRIHNRLASSLLLGLNMPVTHNPNMETNEFLALTEGFASFLPLTTLNMPGVYESTPCKYENPLPILPSEPASGIYNSCEGQVTAFLLDLYDATGVKEQMRTISDKAITGEPVPDAIMREEKWVDNLTDPNLVRIRTALGKSSGIVSSVQTISDFIIGYTAAYPQDAHALKTIAYNRGIAAPNMPERMPFIDGQIEIGRADNKTVWAKIYMAELDPEDRRYVTMDCWRQNGSTLTRVGQTIKFGTNWRDIKFVVVQSFNLTPSQGPNDKLWLVLSDEMKATTYCVPVPEALPEDDSSNTSSGGNNKDPWDRVFIKIPTPQIDRGDPANKISSIKGNISSIQKTMNTDVNQAKITEFQSAIRAARSEMQAYAQAQELALRIDSALSGMAANFGGVQLPSKTLRNTNNLKIRGADSGISSITSDRMFQQWMGQIASGKGLNKTIPMETKNAMAAQLTLLNNAIQQRSVSAVRAQAAGQRLKSSFAALNFTGETSNLRTEIAKSVDENFNALSAISTDTSLTNVLQQQAGAVKTILAK